MEAYRNEVSTLLILLQVLEHYDYSDSKLEHEHCLSRMSLRKIRQGKDLPNAHEYYFKVFLRIMKQLLDSSRQRLDDECHHRIKELMFKVMLREFGID